ISNRLEDRIKGEERIAGEVHLGHQPVRERAPKDRQMDVRGPPGIRMVSPRVRAWLDGNEAVAALVVGQAAARAREVRVERRGMLIDLVVVAAGGARPADLDPPPPPPLSPPSRAPDQ